MCEVPITLNYKLQYKALAGKGYTHSYKAMLKHYCSSTNSHLSFPPLRQTDNPSLHLLENTMWIYAQGVYWIASH